MQLSQLINWNWYVFQANENNIYLSAYVIGKYCIYGRSCNGFMKKWKLLVKAYNTYNTSQELGAAHCPGYL